MRVAAIDLGTVTSRLLVADVDAQGFHELERVTIITHLGEGLVQSGRINHEALAREKAACSSFLEHIEQYAAEGCPVERLKAVTTSAMRDAANRDEVLDALRSIGLPVEIIAGSREAELSFLGALSGFTPQELGDGAVMLADVGGGSTELILGRRRLSAWVPEPSAPGSQNSGQEGSGGFREHILCAHSFDIGSRRITERFLKDDPPSSVELAAARKHARATLDAFISAFPERPGILLAVAGAATSVVSMRDKCALYDPERVHKARVTAGELQDVLDELAALPLEKRKMRIGLEPARASVIVGGLVILEQILALSGLDSFVGSETDILHGIALSQLA